MLLLCVLLSLKDTSQWHWESVVCMCARVWDWYGLALAVWWLLLPNTWNLGAIEEGVPHPGIKWFLAVTVGKRKYCMVSFTFIKIAFKSLGFCGSSHCVWSQCTAWEGIQSRRRKACWTGTWTELKCLKWELKSWHSWTCRSVMGISGSRCEQTVKVRDPQRWILPKLYMKGQMGTFVGITELAASWKLFEPDVSNLKPTLLHLSYLYFYR